MTICQGRLFSYNDTHRHRLGANWDQIPVNCPYRWQDHQTLDEDNVGADGGVSAEYVPGATATIGKYIFEHSYEAYRCKDYKNCANFRK